jgi:glycosyltransferase involved in cell wall biosynthesis
MAAAAGKSRYVFTTHDPFLMNRLRVGIRRKLTDGFVMRRADAVVALSYAEKKFLCASYSLRPDKVVVIGNGIDTDLFKASEGASRGPAQLLFVGQLRKFKGLDYLLQALPVVRQRRPAVTLTVVSHSSTLVNYYRRLARARGVADIVCFPGAKSQFELAHLYSSATLLISPSLGECLSTVVLEAMACQCPVVATDVGGIREQLGSVGGVIVPPGDSSSLAESICSLLDDSERRRVMGVAGRQRILGLFNVNSMIDAHMRLYKCVLESPRESGRNLDGIALGIRSALRLV